MDQIIEVLFEGGPLDGLRKQEMLAEDQTEYRCLMAPALPFFGGEKVDPAATMKLGRYTLNQSSEGLAVFAWRGIVD